MNIIRIFVTAIFCSLYFDYGQCIIPMIPVAVIGFGAALVGWGYKSGCFYKECCTDKYIPANFSSLRSILKTEFYGQGLAVETVLNALQDHVNAEKNDKALVMSFHGSAGTGKNYLVNFIVDALYKNGAKSNYVHIYNGYLDFSTKENCAEYQKEIKKEITRHLKTCPRSIFIFDDVDHIQEGMLDELLLFLDYNPRVLNVDPTQAIFIFVTNTGATEIKKLFIQMWQDGKKREEAEISDFESLLINSALHEHGGLRNSDIVEMKFIDHYIPFLPLERADVRECIYAAFRRRNLAEPTPRMIEEVLAQLTFEPSPHYLYSESGCKRVDPKVSAMIATNHLTNTKKTKTSLLSDEL